MPTIAMIDRTRIYINTKEANHVIPHFHATDGNNDVSIRISDRVVLAGDLKAKSLARVIAWAEENEDTLNAEWSRFHG